MKAIIYLMLLASALLSGCGQKGPLYLPDEDAPIYVPKDHPDYKQDDSDEIPDLPEQDQ